MNLGRRIKAYEQMSNHMLPARLPVIIRCDGKGFSNYIRRVGAERPFDGVIADTMAKSMIYVAQEISGCVFGYTQSDEISFVVRNNMTAKTEPWFNNEINKITSVVASLLTAYFNKNFVSDQLAIFDTRVFAVPSTEEAANTMIWRQQDCIRNSISTAAYYELGKKMGKKTAHKAIYGLKSRERTALLLQETGINWDNYPIKFQRGIGCYKQSKEVIHEDNKVIRNAWTLDEQLPLFAENQEFLLNIFNHNNLIK